MDHVEPKTEIQVQEVQLVFGGPQASSCEDANIAVIKASLGVSNHISWALLIFVFYLWVVNVH
jgi:hypothetical protein